jgi:hypothetical protein
MSTPGRRQRRVTSHHLNMSLLAFADWRYSSPRPAAQFRVGADGMLCSDGDAQSGDGPGGPGDLVDQVRKVVGRNLSWHDGSPRALRVHQARSRQVTHRYVRSATRAWIEGPYRIPKLTGGFDSRHPLICENRPLGPLLHTGTPGRRPDLNPQSRSTQPSRRNRVAPDAPTHNQALDLEGVAA